ncbi:MAG: PHP domain-containing protein [Candidatus Altiarchaeales archaeon]|nr:PHP domain-containing protein [Candidatus Altiarchaeales archaeon]MBD3416027.1 PHP domain-containing protein [Candidatus Altiarchaeales archaeon]
MLFELHVHSSYSDGKPTPKEILEYAGSRLDGIALTDHDEIAGALEALEHAGDDFTVIPGAEVSSVEGHILALGVTELVPRDLSAAETVDRIHGLGGLAVAAHPYDVRRAALGDLILKLPFDAVEVVNGHTFGNKKDPVKVCREAGLPMVGGSDAHILSEVGSVTVEFDGDWRNAIKKGNVTIDSRNIAHRIFNFGVGAVHRRISRSRKKGDH